jgi:hypothetical protein
MCQIRLQTVYYFNDSLIYLDKDDICWFYAFKYTVAHFDPYDHFLFQSLFLYALEMNCIPN